MRLENLYPNFGKASPEDQAAYIAAYRLRRAEDMEKPSTYPKTKKKKMNLTSSKVSLTEEEKLLVKLLGLKQKDVIALREAVVDEVDDEDVNLLNDTTFEGGEDE